jgi:hypothetical protein
MYAKLFSRITESSLMEESLPTRCVFLLMLAIADPHGYVIGTDVAIARRLNVPVGEFALALNRLMSTDADSNSREQEGRRIVRSDCERGYHIVNYVAYGKIRDEDHRRSYMRELMAAKREKERLLAAVSTPLAALAALAHVPTDSPVDAPVDKDVGRNTAAPPRAPIARTAKAAAAASTSSDSEWLEGLRADPAYEGIDVDREHGKMSRWCGVSGKQPTRRRFVNWLNRADRTLAGQTSNKPAADSKF